MRRTRCALGIALFGFTACSNAAVIFSDNFDGYADQAAFEVAWPAIGTTATASLKSAQLSTTQSKSPTKSVFVPVSTTATTALTEYRNRASFTDTTLLTASTQLTWSFDFYDSPAGAATSSNPQRNFSNLQDTTGPGGTNQLVSMGLNSNQLNTDSGGAYYMARILGYSLTTTTPITDPDGGAAETGTLGTSPFFKLNDFATSPKRSQGWHNLKVILTSDDGIATDYAFYVDNILAEKVSNVGGGGTLRQYDNITIGSGLTNGGINAYFDNESLEFGTVPEPASVASIGFAGLLLRRRRAI